MEDLFQFDRPGIGSILTYCAIEGVLLLLLVVTIEVRTYTVCTHHTNINSCISLLYMYVYTCA